MFNSLPLQAKAKYTIILGSSAPKGSFLSATETFLYIGLHSATKVFSLVTPCITRNWIYKTRLQTIQASALTAFEIGKKKLNLDFWDVLIVVTLAFVVKNKVNEDKAIHTTSWVRHPSQRLDKHVQPSRGQNIPSWRKRHAQTFRSDSSVTLPFPLRF